MARGTFLKHAAVYGLGQVLAYAGTGFLLIPLYTRCLGAAEYGTMEVFNRASEVVLLCLLTNGLRQALLSFHNQTEHDGERQAVIGSALLLTVLFLVIGGGTVVAFAEPIGAWLETDEPSLLRLAVLSMALESLGLMLLALAQARVQSVFFTAVTLGQLLARVVLISLFVAGFDWGLEGVLIASCLVSAGVVVLLLGRELARGGLRADGKNLKAMAWFALPFVPGGVGFFLLRNGDRFFLLQNVSLAEVGVYALGYKLATLVTMLTRRPLYQVWSASMYDAAKQPDAAEVFGKVFTRILAAYVGVGLALCLVAEELIDVLSGAGFSAAEAVVAPVVLAYFFLTAADLMDAGFYIRRRTIWKTPITIASTAIVLGLYALLIPSHGMTGAALATLLGFFAHAVLTGLVARRVFPVRYEWGRVVVPLGWAAVIWLASRGLPSGMGMVPVKVIVWVAWPVGLWLAGVVSEEEKEWARAAGRWLISRVGRRSKRSGAPVVPVAGEGLV